MAEKISHHCKTLSRLVLVAALLSAGLFTTSANVHAQSPIPSSTRSVNVIPPLVPAGQDGELDHTFGFDDGDGIDGFVQLQEDPHWVGPTFGPIGVQQSDGKVVTGTLLPDDQGSVVSLQGLEYLRDDLNVGISTPLIMASVISRQNFDGSRDITFGDGGTVNLSSIVESGALLTQISLQRDGKILAVGVVDPNSFNVGSTNDSGVDSLIALRSGYPFVTRLLSDGTPDTTFGFNGTVHINTGEFNYGIATSMAIQHDGKIVVSGLFDNQYLPTSDVQLQDLPASQVFVSRLNVDGELDSSFGLNGTFHDDFGMHDHWIDSTHIQSDGKIVLVGAAYEIDSSSTHTFVARVTSSGLGDLDYGISGVVIASEDPQFRYITKSVMQVDNKILVTIYSSTNGAAGAVSTTVLRLLTDGSIDPNFGTDGELVLGDDVNSYTILGLAVQPDGKIVATGNFNDSPGTFAGSLVVYRFRSDGNSDSTFGDGGLVEFDLVAGIYGFQTLVQPNGQLLIFGLKIDVNNQPNFTEFAIRLNSSTPVSINGLSPSRLFDTRAGSPQGTIEVNKNKFGESDVLRVNLAGVSGLPDYGIGAVTLNVTVTDPEDTGYITVYPCDQLPLASNINFVKNQTISASVTTAVSPTGDVCIYASTRTNLIADINSWSAPNAGYTSLPPTRLFDTRTLSPQGSILVDKKKYGVDTELRVKVAGAAGLPDDLIGSISLNVTVTEPEAEGFLTVYPCGTRPIASSLNFVADQTISTSVTSPISDDGEICIYSSTKTNLVADVSGWFVHGGGVTPVVPTRLIDTRSASPQGAIVVTKKKYNANDELRLPLAAVAGLPSDGIGTVQLTVTATNPEATGFITVYPCGTLPVASNLNYVSNQTIAASVTTQVSSDGEVCIHTHSTTNIIVDINGWGKRPRYGCDGSILEVTESERIQIACR